MADSRIHKKAMKDHPEKVSQVRGYVVSEDDDMMIRDAANGLFALSMMIDDQNGDDCAHLSEIPQHYVAGLLRSVSRSLTSVYDDAKFTNGAQARPRHCV